MVRLTSDNGDHPTFLVGSCGNAWNYGTPYLPEKLGTRNQRQKFVPDECMIDKANGRR